MATMIEKKMNSIIKEIEKLNKSLERNQNLLQKKISKCEKLNCNWTMDEWFEHRDVDATPKQKEAWFEKSCQESEVEDLERRLQNAETRLSKVTGKFEYEAWVKQFTEECAKDGILIDENPSSNFITGKTPSGKKFMVDINNGMTERSWHCYTLTINGETVFTSGTFATCYQVIKNR